MKVMGDIEVRQCQMCGSEKVQVQRQYYYYNISCECCGEKTSDHFEIVYYCNDCSPKPPHRISAVVLPKPSFKRMVAATMLLMLASLLCIGQTYQDHMVMIGGEVENYITPATPVIDYYGAVINYVDAKPLYGNVIYVPRRRRISNYGPINPFCQPSHSLVIDAVKIQDIQFSEPFYKFDGKD